MHFQDDADAQKQQVGMAATAVEEQRQQEDEAEELGEYDPNSFIATCCSGSFFWLSIRGIVPLLFVAAFLGANNGWVASVLPDLMNQTFGNSSYTVNGVTGTAKGLWIMISGTAMGAISDLTGRRPVAMVALAVTMSSPLVYVFSGDFAIYWYIDALTGIIFPIMGLLFASVADIVKVEGRHIMRARGETPESTDKLIAVINSVALSVYLAMIWTSFVGALIPTRLMMALTAASSLFAIAAAWKMPNTGKKNARVAAPDLDPESTGSPVAGNDSDRSPLLLAASSSAVNKDDNEDEQEGDKATHVSALSEDPANGGKYGATDAAGAGAADSSSSSPSSPTSTAGGAADTLSTAASRTWRVLKNNRNLRWLCLVSVGLTAEMTIFNSVVLLYLKDTLHCTAEDISMFLLCAAVVSVINCFFVIWLGRTSFVKNIKAMIIIALFGNIVLCAGMAFAKEKWQPVALTLLLFAGLMGPPSVSAASSVLVHPAEFGTSMGLITAARSFAQTASPFLYGYLFKMAENTSFPGWPYFVGVALCLGSFVAIFFIKWPDHNSAADGAASDAAVMPASAQE